MNGYSPGSQQIGLCTAGIDNEETVNSTNRIEYSWDRKGRNSELLKNKPGQEQSGPYFGLV